MGLTSGRLLIGLWGVVACAVAGSRGGATSSELVGASAPAVARDTSAPLGQPDDSALLAVSVNIASACPTRQQGPLTPGRGGFCAESLIVEGSVLVTPGHKLATRVAAVLGFAVEVANKGVPPEGQLIDRVRAGRFLVTLPPSGARLLIDTTISANGAVSIPFPGQRASLWDQHPLIRHRYAGMWIPTRICAQVTALATAATLRPADDNVDRPAPEVTMSTTRIACLDLVVPPE